MPNERRLRRFIDAEEDRADEIADDVAVAGCIKRDADACSAAWIRFVLHGAADPDPAAAGVVSGGEETGRSGRCSEPTGQAAVARAVDGDSPRGHAAAREAGNEVGAALPGPDEISIRTVQPSIPGRLTVERMANVGLQRLDVP